MLKTVLYISVSYILKHTWYNILFFPASRLTRESLHRLWSLTQARKLGTVSPILISPGMHYASHIGLFFDQLLSTHIYYLVDPHITRYHPIWLNWLKQTSIKWDIWNIILQANPAAPCKRSPLGAFLNSTPVPATTATKQPLKLAELVPETATTQQLEEHSWTSQTNWSRIFWLHFQRDILHFQVSFLKTMF